MANWIRQILFPAVCYHCKERTASPTRYLCDECIGDLFLLETQGRCRQCFALIDEEPGGILRPSHRRCHNCRERGGIFEDVGAVWEYSGAARSLVHAFKLQKNFFLAESFVSFLILQIDAFGWDDLDLITAIPQSPIRAWGRGYNPPELVAKALGRALNIPYVDLLHKRVGSLPQTAQSREERMKPLEGVYFIKENKKKEWSNKRILLLDDVITTGQTLHDAGQALLRLIPKALYGISLARGA